MAGKKLIKTGEKINKKKAEKIDGIGPEDIKQRWVELEGDKFYKDKLDFHTIQRSFDQKS